MGNIPEDVVRDMAEIAPMLSILGYDPYANPPNYGNADSWVKDNTLKVKAEKNLWESKAKQILNRDPVPVEESNPDDTDSPDGGGAGNNIENDDRRDSANDVDKERT